MQIKYRCSCVKSRNVEKCKALLDMFLFWFTSSLFSLFPSQRLPLSLSNTLPDMLPPFQSISISIRMLPPLQNLQPLLICCSVQLGFQSPPARPASPLPLPSFLPPLLPSTPTPPPTLPPYHPTTSSHPLVYCCTLSLW